MTPPPKASSLARIVLRGTVWTTLGSYAKEIIGFSAGLVLARVLPLEVFGFVSLAAFWAAVLNLRTKAGLNYAAIHQPATTGELLGTFYVLDLALAGVSFGLSCLVAVLLPYWQYPPEVAIALIALMGAESLAALVSPLAIALEKEMQVSRLTLISLITYLAAYAVAIPLALSGAGLWSLLAINLVAGVVSLAGVYVVCRQRWPAAFALRWRFDRQMAATLLRQGLPTGLSFTTLAAVVNQFDNFLIGTFVGADVLGLYDRAYRIASWPNLLATTIVSRIGFLTFSKVRDDQPRLTEAVQLSLWGLAVIGLPLALGLLFGAGDIIQVLYGDRWAASAPFLRFLALYSLTWPFVSVGFWLSAALGNSRAAVGMTLLQAITIIGLGTPLTLTSGVSGTLVAVGVTMIVAFAVSNYYIFKRVPVSGRRVYGAPAVAGVAALAAVWLAQQPAGWAQLLPIFRLGLIGIIIAGVFGGVLFLLEGNTLKERVRRVRALW